MKILKEILRNLRQGPSSLERTTELSELPSIAELTRKNKYKRKINDIMKNYLKSYL